MANNFKLSNFKQQVEYTQFFNFTTETGIEISLTAVRGCSHVPGKAKSFHYWHCVITAEGYDLQKNIVSSYGPISDEEGLMYLDGEQPIFYCEDDTNKRVGIKIPADIAALCNEFIHTEVSLS